MMQFSTGSVLPRFVLLKKVKTALSFSLSPLTSVSKARLVLHMDICTYINHAIINFRTCSSYSKSYSILQKRSHTEKSLMNKG